MQQDETLKVAIAETSVIIRSGLALVLKRVQGMKILPIEIASPDTLSDCIRLHKPDILIINPSFPGYFDIQKFRLLYNMCGSPLFGGGSVVVALL